MKKLTFLEQLHKVTQNVAIKEGFVGILRNLAVISRFPEEPMRKVARESNLPVPICVAIRNEFEKLAAMYTENIDELEILKGANKKGQLMESLSPDVRKVVDKLIGEGTEEEIVEKFAAIKTALKEEVVTTPKVEENLDYNKFSTKKEVTLESDLNEENEIEDLPESRKSKINKDFQNLLEEQLILAGVKKK